MYFPNCVAIQSPRCVKYVFWDSSQEYWYLLWNPYFLQKIIVRKDYVIRWWLKIKVGWTNIHDEKFFAMWVVASIKQSTICLRKPMMRLSKLKTFLKTVLYEELENIFTANFCLCKQREFHKNFSRLIIIKQVFVLQYKAIID